VVTNSPFYPIHIIGCGDIGQRVAELWLQRGATIIAVRRNESDAQNNLQNTFRNNLQNNSKELDQAGISNMQLDLDNPQSLTALNIDNALVYYFAPPPNKGTRDSRITHFVAALKKQTPKRLVYISTSGVYGDCNGKWVTEADPPKPTSDRSRRRLDAEKQLETYCQGVGTELVILRVPGIYGTNRLPIERIKLGRPIVKDHASFTNRIHEDDLANICVAAGEINQATGIYNASDGVPGTMAQYFIDIAKALELPPPPEISWQEAQVAMSAEMLSYLSESRRIDNKKMLQELQIELLYPNLAAGLKAAVNSNPK